MTSLQAHICQDTLLNAFRECSEKQECLQVKSHCFIPLSSQQGQQHVGYLTLSLIGKKEVWTHLEVCRDLNFSLSENKLLLLLLFYFFLPSKICTVVWISFPSPNPPIYFQTAHSIFFFFISNILHLSGRFSEFHLK